LLSSIPPCRGEVTVNNIGETADRCDYCYVFYKGENGEVAGYIAGKPNEYDECKKKATARFSRKDLPRELEANLVIVFGMKGEQVQKIWYNDALHAVLKQPSAILNIVGRLTKSGIPLHSEK